jgi:NADH:ubiquinone oxidoreductase subunit 3 (subunit A)
MSGESEFQLGDYIAQNIKPGTVSEELTYLKQYLALDWTQYIIILGIAASGVAAFVSTYDAITDINKNMKACLNTDPLKKERNIQFAIILVVAVLAIIIGIIMSVFFRKQENQHRVLSLGVITTGILGLLYAISMQFQSASNTIKLVSSWAVFIVFIMIALVYNLKKSKQRKIQV